MLQVRYFLNNSEIKAPFNHRDLSLQLNFDQDSPDASLATTKWRFVNESASVINTYFENGLSGGNGIFEGMPFNIVLSDGSNIVTFENYLDLVNEAILSCSDIEVNSKEKQRIDWLNDIADSFSFEYLHEQTSHLPSSYFVPVPYIINAIPNNRDIFLAGLSVFVIVNEIRSAVVSLGKDLADIGGVFTTPSGVVKAVLFIGYLLLLLIALVRLIKDLIDLIIQPVKYHSGMYVKDHFIAACNHLGLTFESSIFDSTPFNKLLILPEKFQNPESTENDKLFGFLTPDNTVQKGYFNGTFGDLIRIMKVMFNAKVVMKDGGVLAFERVDWVNGSATYIVPDLRVEKYTTNADEIKSNYQVQFKYDVNDKNTIQDYTGNTFTVTTEPVTVTDKKLLLLQGLEQKLISFALGRRKEKLTKPEEVIAAFLDIAQTIMNGLITAVNAIINVINEVAKIIKVLNKILKLVGFKKQFDVPSIKPLDTVDYGSIINDRIGMLLLENDNVLVPKLFLLDKAGTARNNKIPTNNKDIVNAKYLWDNFHFINSFVPSNSKPNANQWVIKELERVPFCLDDFLKVKNNSRIFDVSGNEAKILSLEWNPWDRIAKIKYKINKLYTKNLKETYDEAKGY